MSLSRKVRTVARECEDHLHEIAALFKPGAKLTLIVRTPGNVDADLLLTIDEIDEAIAVLQRSKERKAVVA